MRLEDEKLIVYVICFFFYCAFRNYLREILRNSIIFMLNIFLQLREELCVCVRIKNDCELIQVVILIRNFVLSLIPVVDHTSILQLSLSCIN